MKNDDLVAAPPSQSDLDIEIGGDRSLNDPDLSDAVQDILNHLADYTQTQGAIGDEEMSSVIDDYIFEKISRGEIDDDADTASDSLRRQAMEAWRERREEVLYGAAEERA